MILTRNFSSKQYSRANVVSPNILPIYRRMIQAYDYMCKEDHHCVTLTSELSPSLSRVLNVSNFNSFDGFSDIRDRIIGHIVRNNNPIYTEILLPKKRSTWFSADINSENLAPLKFIFKYLGDSTEIERRYLVKTSLLTYHLPLYFKYHQISSSFVTTFELSLRFPEKNIDALILMGIVDRSEFSLFNRIFSGRRKKNYIEKYHILE